jgi:PAS domain S-box-containing protein
MVSQRSHVVSAEQRQMALLRLGDELRQLSDAQDIAMAASRLCGETLGALRAGYGDIDEPGAHVQVTGDWRAADSAPGLTGRHRFADFGSFIEDLRLGRVVVIDDVSLDPRTASGSEALAEIQARSLLNVPLMSKGRLAGVFLVHQNQPRGWTPDEVAFVRAVADRTWAASATARALAELRSVNEALERQVEARTADRNRLWQLSAEIMLVARFTGEIVAVNPAWHTMLGWSENELIGRSFADLVHPDDRERTLNAARSIASGASFPAFENRYLHHDGGYCWISWSAVHGDDHIIAVGRDVTGFKQQAESLKAAEDQLRQSQKMEAVGQLTGGIAHDFNNLLTIISTSIQLLQRPALAEERRQRFMGSISSAVARAAKLTGQLLAFARRQTLQPVVFDAVQNVAAIGEMLQTLVGARVDVSFDRRDGACMVDVDPGQFDTAVVNMAANARDAMDGVGKLRIRVWQTDGIPALRSEPAKGGAFVAVSVEDTGSGIAPESIDQIFEPFYTTKPVGQGTGLGLSQVFGFAQQSGGDVQVRSALGAGTTFTIYLPMARRRIAPVFANVAEPAPVDASPHASLLLVEDNHDVAEAAEATLVELGYRVVVAHGARQALALLAQQPSDYCAVFSDVVMADMDGISLAREVRRLYPSMPVLLSSGYSSVLASTERHEFTLLPKPYSMAALSAAVRTTISAGNTEKARLMDLDSLAVLDTGAEDEYDLATRLAAGLFDAPIALMSLIDEKRQWFKSRVGIDIDETPREHAFCAHAITEPRQVMVVNDATKDARFADNPLVVGGPGIRFYAGAPLVTTWGHAIGTICVIDSKPREVDDRQLEALKQLADQVVRRLEQSRIEKGLDDLPGEAGRQRPAD